MHPCALLTQASSAARTHLLSLCASVSQAARAAAVEQALHGGSIAPQARRFELLEVWAVHAAGLQRPIAVSQARAAAGEQALHGGGIAPQAGRPQLLLLRAVHAAADPGS